MVYYESNVIMISRSFKHFIQNSEHFSNLENTMFKLKKVFKVLPLNHSMTVILTIHVEDGGPASVLDQDPSQRHGYHCTSIRS